MLRIYAQTNKQKNTQLPSEGVKENFKEGLMFRLRVKG